MLSLINFQRDLIFLHFLLLVLLPFFAMVGIQLENESERLCRVGWSGNYHVVASVRICVHAHPHQQ